MNIDELSDEQLNAAVTEQVMGWQRQDGYNYWMSFPAGETFKLHALIATWTPSTDMARALKIEERIAELDKRAEYAEALQQVVGRQSRTDGYSPGLFGLIHATPRQRCLAALAAIGEG